VSFKTNLMPVVRGSGGTKIVVGLTRDATHEVNLVESAERQAAVLRTLGIALPSAVYPVRCEHPRCQLHQSDVGQRPGRNGATGRGGGRGRASACSCIPTTRDACRAHWDSSPGCATGKWPRSAIASCPGRRYRRYCNRETVFSRDVEGKVKLVLGIFRGHDRARPDRAGSPRPVGAAC
jgi:hypothetical protein